MRNGTVPTAVLALALAWAPTAGAQERLPGEPGARVDPGLRERLALWDPRADDWESETFHEDAKKRLALLKEAWAAGADADALAPLLADGFTAGALVPPRTRVRFEDGVFRVLEEARDEDLQEEGPPPLRAGADGLAEALREFGARYGASGPRRVNLKIDGLQLEADAGLVRTRARFLAEGPSPEGMRLTRAVWTLTWQRSAEGPPVSPVQPKRG